MEHKDLDIMNMRMPGYGKIPGNQKKQQVQRPEAVARDSACAPQQQSPGVESGQ